VSYQQPPDHQADTPGGPPPGWYLDPGGLQVARWWDGTQWSPHTQPLAGIRQEPQPPYPDATAAASGGYDAFRQERVGRHRQQSVPQDGPAHISGLASDPYADSLPPAQPEHRGSLESQEPQDPPRPHDSAAALRSHAHDARRPPGNRKTRYLLAALGGFIIFLVAALVIVKVAASSAAAPANFSAPASSSAPAAPQSTSPADCSGAVQSWLGETGWYFFPDTIQQGITLLANDAQAYLSTIAPNISQPEGQQTATTYLTSLGNGPFGSLSAADPIPSCADPGGYWQDALTQADNATTTDAGTPQAATDMHAVLSDLSSLHSEVSQNAPGSGFTVPGS
jgi:hypothetical protein